MHLKFALESQQRWQSRQTEKTGECFVRRPSFEPRYCSDADDPRRADGDAGFHHGLVFDVQQTHLKGNNGHHDTRSASVSYESLRNVAFPLTCPT